MGGKADKSRVDVKCARVHAASTSQGQDGNHAVVDCITDAAQFAYVSDSYFQRNVVQLQCNRFGEFARLRLNDKLNSFMVGICLFAHRGKSLEYVINLGIAKINRHDNCL